MLIQGDRGPDTLRQHVLAGGMTMLVKPGASHVLPFLGTQVCLWAPVAPLAWRRQWYPTRTLARRIPWTEEPGRLQSMGLLRVGHD